MSLVADRHRRSVAKALSWRILASMVTLITAYLVTGSTGWALAIGAWDTLLKLILYYLHERGWEFLTFGRQETSTS